MQNSPSSTYSYTMRTQASRHPPAKCDTISNLQPRLFRSFRIPCAYHDPSRTSASDDRRVVTSLQGSPDRQCRVAFLGTDSHSRDCSAFARFPRCSTYSAVINVLGMASFSTLYSWPTGQDCDDGSCFGVGGQCGGVPFASLCNGLQHNPLPFLLAELYPMLSSRETHAASLPSTASAVMTGKIRSQALQKIPQAGPSRSSNSPMIEGITNTLSIGNTSSCGSEHAQTLRSILCGNHTVISYRFALQYNYGITTSLSLHISPSLHTASEQPSSQ
jgi:hypothetical protein